jgi:hypothetical protein
MKMPQFTAAACLENHDPTTYWTVTPASPHVTGLSPASRPGCFHSCMKEMGDDSFANENCHCICYGHPGKTCWLI